MVVNILFFITFIIHIYFIKSFGVFDYSHKEANHLFIQAGPLFSEKSTTSINYNEIGICKEERIIKNEDTLGEILTGQTLYTTGHIIHIGEVKFCQKLCHNDFGDTTIIKNLIKNNYYVNYYVDKLPAGLIKSESQRKKIIYNQGIPLGKMENDNYIIYNHLEFHISLKKVDSNKYNVVGFSVLPLSIKQNGEYPICDLENKEVQYLKEGEKILYSYDVYFEESKISFAFRWDHYKISEKKINWVGIIISNFLIFLFAIIVILNLFKNINNDINEFNSRTSNYEKNDEYEWENLSGDVFRAPARNKILLTSFIGSGMQLFFMLLISLIFVIFVFLNPEKRTFILIIGILYFCFIGIPAGYISAILYKFFGGVSWIKNALLTSIIFPSIIAFGYIIVNIFLKLGKSNSAVKFYEIICLFLLWFVCTFPLILIGSCLGIKSKKMKLYSKINQVSSIIPEKPWYLHYRFLSLITGFIGFVTIFIELNDVMSSLWNHEIYFIAIFLWISFYLFIIVMSEISVLAVFWNLKYGDYIWWWKSFIIGASPVIYFILYSIYYFFYLNLTHLSAMIVYFGFVGLISILYIFIFGSISVMVTFKFLDKIYSKIRHN